MEEALHPAAIVREILLHWQLGSLEVERGILMGSHLFEERKPVVDSRTMEVGRLAYPVVEVGSREVLRMLLMRVELRELRRTGLCPPSDCCLSRGRQPTLEAEPWPSPTSSRYDCVFPINVSSNP